MPSDVARKMESLYRVIVRHLLAAAFITSASFATISTAEAKSIWLNCGSQVINLDSAKERFSMTISDKVYQGSALFTPGQIDFEVLWFASVEGGGAKYVYSIDRKTLNYTKTALANIPPLDGTHWRQTESSEEFPNPKSGKCSIMKTPPTAGNKI